MISVDALGQAGGSALAKREAVTPSAKSGKRFTVIPPRDSGITFTNRLAGLEYYKNMVAHNGAGVAAGDVNGDDLADVFLCNIQGENVLYLNEGGFRFKSIAGAHAMPGVICTGATLVDVDGDGDNDLLVNGVQTGTRLFVNDGSGNYVFVPKSGLDGQGTTTSMALADVDADGDLDDAAETMSADASDGFEMPEIVPATPDDELIGDAGGAGETDDADAFVEPLIDEPDIDELDPDEVAEEILEELRRADIDGPQVEMAPQDETTAARRRPRRAVDYDPAPVPIPAKVPRVLGRKPRVRKVTRVVRHVDPWSVFKIAFVANVVLYIIALTASVLLWNVAHATGTVDNVERFFESFGWQSFEFNGGELYHAAWTAGLFGVIALTGFAVLLATLFNLITDLVGGVRFTVLEEEVVETRTSPLRRFVVRRPEPEVPATVRDASGAMVREAVVDDTGANPGPSR